MREAPGARVGLALAGGGPEGAIYEIGALCALEEAVEGLDLNALRVYVGVSAGAFIAACLANQLTPAQMARAIVKSEPGEHPFVPHTFLTPALRELARRGARVPRLFAEALWEYARHPGDHTLGEALTRLARALPVGIFDNEPIRAYLEQIYTIKNRSDDFRRLPRKLVIVAADLESGQPVRFGEEPFAHVPISRAVQASSALPGLYPPVEIDGRHYVDGVLLKTLHASVALEAGARLVLCINPIVPVDMVRAVREGAYGNGHLVERGLPTVLSQTFRTLIHSRLVAGFSAYERRYRGADVVLLEPPRDDYQMFFTNIFRFSARRRGGGPRLSLDQAGAGAPRRRAGAGVRAPRAAAAPRGPGPRRPRPVAAPRPAAGRRGARGAAGPRAHPGSARRAGRVRLGFVTIAPQGRSSMNRRIFSVTTLGLFVFCLALTGIAAAAEPQPKEGEKPALQRAEPRYVCMVNDRVFDKEQIPVEVEKRTYYGCCQMCKQALTERPELRSGTDPVSGKPVDKAKSVIGSLPDGSVLYFESEKTFTEYEKKLRR